MAGARIQDIVLLGSAEKLDWQLTERDLKSAFRNINLAAMLMFDREVGKDQQSEASDEILKHGSPV